MNKGLFFALSNEGSEVLYKSRHKKVDIKDVYIYIYYSLLASVYSRPVGCLFWLLYMCTLGHVRSVIAGATQDWISLLSSQLILHLKPSGPCV